MSHVVTAIEEVAVVGHDTATFSGKPYTRFRTQLTTNKGKTEHLIRYIIKRTQCFTIRQTGYSYTA